MIKMNSLPEGMTGRIKKTDKINLNLSDFGIIEGTQIKCVKKSKGIGAYMIKGCVIALRDEECSKIILEIGDENG